MWFIVKNLTADSAWTSTLIMGPIVLIGTPKPINRLSEIFVRMSSVVYIAKIIFKNIHKLIKFKL